MRSEDSKLGLSLERMSSPFRGLVFVAHWSFAVLTGVLNSLTHFRSCVVQPIEAESLSRAILQLFCLARSLPRCNT